MAKIYQIEHREFYNQNGFSTLNACSPFVIKTFSNKKKAINFFNDLCQIKLNKELDVQECNLKFYETLMYKAEQKYNQRGFRNAILLNEYVISND